MSERALTIDAVFAEQDAGLDGDLYGPAVHRVNWRAIATELAAALRIAGACPRCGGSGQVDYHPRGQGSTVRDNCDRCGGMKYLPGPAAAIAAFDGAMGSGTT